MQLFTATAQSQGRRANDFSFTVEGELVFPGIICGDDRDDPDGGCGCGRSFSGMGSFRATTTALVRDLDLTCDDLMLAVHSHLTAAGWLPGDEPEIELREAVEPVVAWLVDAAAEFQIGDVVERRLDDVVLRERASH